MTDAEGSLEERLRAAIAAGEFSNLRGEGKPLKLEDDPYTPEHLRIAHKLMRDNAVVPGWIAEGRELHERRAQIVRQIRRAAQRYRQSYDPGTDAETRWRDAKGACHTAVRQFNRAALSYNLKVAPGIEHLMLLDADREIAAALAGG